MLPGIMSATFFAAAAVVVGPGPGAGCIIYHPPMPRAAMMIITSTAMDCIRVTALLDNISLFPLFRVEKLATPNVFNSLRLWIGNDLTA
jgi:hypothetical protein